MLERDGLTKTFKEENPGIEYMSDEVQAGYRATLKGCIQGFGYASTLDMIEQNGARGGPGYANRIGIDGIGLPLIGSLQYPDGTYAGRVIKPGVKEAFESLKPEDKLSEKVATPHEDGSVFIPDAETLANYEDKLLLLLETFGRRAVQKAVEFDCVNDQVFGEDDPQGKQDFLDLAGFEDEGVSILSTDASRSDENQLEYGVAYAFYNIDDQVKADINADYLARVREEINERYRRGLQGF